METDYAVGKAKRASAKVYKLIDGDKGLPVSVGINLFKTLIRPHMEYAIPVWSSIAEKDLVKFENVQTQSLWRIIGAKAHSSSSAVKVVNGVLPFRCRKRELCFREYTPVKCKDESHLLVKLLSSSIRIRLRFCPLEYLNVMSKELEKATAGCILQKRITVSVTEMSSEDRIGRLNIAKPSTNSDITSKYVEAINQFVKLHKETSALTFTDG